MARQQAASCAFFVCLCTLNARPLTLTLTSTTWMPMTMRMTSAILRTPYSESATSAMGNVERKTPKTCFGFAWFMCVVWIVDVRKVTGRGGDLDPGGLTGMKEVMSTTRDKKP